jgi:hypothetical protein
MMHICGPSYSGGRGRRIVLEEVNLGKVSSRPCLQNKEMQKDGCVAIPEKKTKEKRTNRKHQKDTIRLEFSLGK